MITEIPVKRDQILVREAHANSCIYLIKEGDFELSKQIRKPADKTDPNSKYMVEETRRICNKNKGIQTNL